MFCLGTCLPEMSKDHILPYGWKQQISKKFPGRVYYFNIHTGTSVWNLSDLFQIESETGSGEGNHEILNPTSSCTASRASCSSSSDRSDVHISENSLYNMIGFVHSHRINSGGSSDRNSRNPVGSTLGFVHCHRSNSDDLGSASTSSSQLSSKGHIRSLASLSDLSQVPKQLAVAQPPQSLRTKKISVSQTSGNAHKKRSLDSCSVSATSSGQSSPATRECRKRVKKGQSKVPFESVNNAIKWVGKPVRAISFTDNVKQFEGFGQRQQQSAASKFHSAANASLGSEKFTNAIQKALLNRQIKCEQAVPLMNVKIPPKANQMTPLMKAKTNVKPKKIMPLINDNTDKLPKDEKVVVQNRKPWYLNSNAVNSKAQIVGCSNLPKTPRNELVYIPKNGNVNLTTRLSTSLKDLPARNLPCHSKAVQCFSKDVSSRVPSKNACKRTPDTDFTFSLSDDQPVVKAKASCKAIVTKQPSVHKRNCDNSTLRRKAPASTTGSVQSDSESKKANVCNVSQSLKSRNIEQFSKTKDCRTDTTSSASDKLLEAISKPAKGFVTNTQHDLPRSTKEQSDNAPSVVSHTSSETAQHTPRLNYKDVETWITSLPDNKSNHIEEEEMDYEQIQENQTSNQFSGIYAADSWVTAGIQDVPMDIGMTSVEHGHLIENLQRVRKQVQNTADSNGSSELTSLQLPAANTTPVKHDGSANLFVILDTNVLVSHMKFINELKDMYIKGLGQPILVIPWVVLQELDAFKERRYDNNKSTQLSSKITVRFLFKLLQNNHPRIRGQSAAEAAQTKSGLSVECNDDKILQCCLDWKAKHSASHVVLFSNDKNLCNKAVVNHIKACNKEALMQVIHSLANDSRQLIKLPSDAQLTVAVKPASVSPCTQLSGQQQSDVLKLAEEVSCELQCHLADLLPLVIEEEMKLAYGDPLWLKIVCIKPPWSVEDAVHCILEHWIAVFGLQFKRDAETCFKNLSEFFKTRSVTGVCTLSSVISVLDDVHTICVHLLPHCRTLDRAQTSSYASKVKLCEARVKELHSLCVSVSTGTLPALGLKHLERVASLEKTGGDVSNNNSNPLLDVPSNFQDQVLQVFHTVWGAINNYCGLVFDTVGFSHNLSYERSERVHTKEEALVFLAKLFPVVQQLHHALASVISKPLNETFNNEQALTVLYNCLVNFFTNLHCEVRAEIMLTPAMLHKFCTISTNQRLLGNGLVQIAEFLSQLSQCASMIQAQGSPDESATL